MKAFLVRLLMLDRWAVIEVDGEWIARRYDIDAGWVRRPATGEEIREARFFLRYFSRFR